MITQILNPYCPKVRRPMEVARAVQIVVQSGVLAGLIAARRTRRGHIVGLYRSDEAGLDVDAGPWTTVCEDHAGLVGHETRAVAESYLSHPEDWCPGCQEDEPPDQSLGIWQAVREVLDP